MAGPEELRSSRTLLNRARGFPLAEPVKSRSSTHTFDRCEEGRTCPPAFAGSAFFADALRRFQALDGGNMRLTMVVAPAGYGKTRLLAHWWEQLCEAGRPVHWVGLREADSAHDLVRMLRGHKASNQAGHVNFNDLPYGTVIFVDGLTDGSDAGVLALLRTWMMDPRDDIEFVVAASSIPDLPLTRLEGYGRARRIGPSQLAFDIETARSFMAETSDGVVADCYLQELLDQTDGWPVGIRLLCPEPRRGIDRRTLAMPQADRRIDRFFQEAVFSLLDGDDLDSLVALASLSTWPTNICEAVLPGKFRQSLLEEMYRRQMFVFEDENGDFRPHAMLRRSLLWRQSQRGRGFVRHQRKVVAMALAGNGFLTEAVDLAIEAGDDALAFQWAEACAVDVANRGETARLENWLSRLPCERIALWPRLSLAAATMYYGLRRPQKAREFLDAALDRLNATSIATPDERKAITELTALRAMHAVVTEDSSAALVSNDDPATGLGKAWYALYQDGAAAAIRQLERSGSGCAPIVAMHRLHLEFLFAHHLGDQVKAAEAATRLERMARCEQGAHGAMTALAASCKIQIYWQSGKFEDVLDCEDRILPGLLDCGSIEGIALGYSAIIRSRLACGDVSSALRRLDELYQFARKTGVGRLAMMAQVERIQLWMSVRDMGKAQNELDLLESEQQGSGVLAEAILREERRILDRIHAQVLLVTGRADEAVVLLKKVCEEFARLGFVVELATTQLLLAAALHQTGRRQNARDLAVQALAAGEHAALSSSLVDLGPALHPLLTGLRAQIADAAQEAPSMDYVEHLIARIERTLPDHEPINAIMTAANLSAREAQIASFVASGQSNKEVGRSLGLSNETVKWHLRNIYGKLSVTNRADATRKIMKLLQEACR